MSLMQTLRVSLDKLEALKDIVPLEKHKERLFEIEKLLELGNVWENPKKAGELAKERQKLVGILEKLKNWEKDLNEDVEYCNEFPEESEKELGENASARLSEIEKFELLQMFKDPMDGNNSILTITLGSGGTEAANFVSMLLRMILRWAGANGYKVEELDLKASDEYSHECIDSVSILISGEWAFGYTKALNGVHRLIRNSPYNTGGARQTSFAAISVLPEVDDNIDIKIDDKDLDITPLVRGSKGGQNANKVASSIRLKHIPSGIAIVVSTERDFHQNKRSALSMLKSRLYDIEVGKKNAEKNKMMDAQKTAAFGNQVISYTLTPYSLSKDHRTGFESKNAEAVLDGDIDGFLEAYLRMSTWSSS